MSERLEELEREVARLRDHNATLDRKYKAACQRLQQRTVQLTQIKKVLSGCERCQKIQRQESGSSSQTSSTHPASKTDTFQQSQGKRRVKAELLERYPDAGTPPHLLDAGVRDGGQGGAFNEYLKLFSDSGSVWGLSPVYVRNDNSPEEDKNGLPTTEASTKVTTQNVAQQLVQRETDNSEVNVINKGVSSKTEEDVTATVSTTKSADLQLTEKPSSSSTSRQITGTELVESSELQKGSDVSEKDPPSKFKEPINGREVCEDVPNSDRKHRTGKESEKKSKRDSSKEHGASESLSKSKSQSGSDVLVKNHDNKKESRSHDPEVHHKEEKLTEKTKKNDVKKSHKSSHFSSRPEEKKPSHNKKSSREKTKEKAEEEEVESVFDSKKGVWVTRKVHAKSKESVNRQDKSQSQGSDKKKEKSYDKEPKSDDRATIKSDKTSSKERSSSKSKDGDSKRKHHRHKSSKPEERVRDSASSKSEQSTAKLQVSKDTKSSSNKTDNGHERLKNVPVQTADTQLNKKEGHVSSKTGIVERDQLNSEHKTLNEIHNTTKADLQAGHCNELAVDSKESETERTEGEISVPGQKVVSTPEQENLDNLDYSFIEDTLVIAEKSPSFTAPEKKVPELVTSTPRREKKKTSRPSHSKKHTSSSQKKLDVDLKTIPGVQQGKDGEKEAAVGAKDQGDKSAEKKATPESEPANQSEIESATEAKTQTEVVNTSEKEKTKKKANNSENTKKTVRSVTQKEALPTTVTKKLVSNSAEAKSHADKRRLTLSDYRQKSKEERKQATPSGGKRLSSFKIPKKIRKSVGKSPEKKRLDPLKKIDRGIDSVSFSTLGKPPPVVNPPPLMKLAPVMDPPPPVDPPPAVPSLLSLKLDPKPVHVDRYTHGPVQTNPCVDLPPPVGFHHEAPPQPNQMILDIIQRMNASEPPPILPPPVNQFPPCTEPKPPVAIPWQGPVHGGISVRDPRMAARASSSTGDTQRPRDPRLMRCQWEKGPPSGPPDAPTPPPPTAFYPALLEVLQSPDLSGLSPSAQAVMERFSLTPAVIDVLKNAPAQVVSSDTHQPAPPTDSSKSELPSVLLDLITKKTSTEEQLPSQRLDPRIKPSLPPMEGHPSSRRALLPTPPTPTHSTMRGPPQDPQPPTHASNIIQNLLNLAKTSQSPSEPWEDSSYVFNPDTGSFTPPTDRYPGPATVPSAPSQSSTDPNQQPVQSLLENFPTETPEPPKKATEIGRKCTMMMKPNVRTCYPVKAVKVEILRTDEEQLLSYLSCSKRRTRTNLRDLKVNLRAEKRRLGATLPETGAEMENEDLYGGLDSTFVREALEEEAEEEEGEGEDQSALPGSLSPATLERLWEEGVDIHNPDAIDMYMKLSAMEGADTERYLEEDYLDDEYLDDDYLDDDYLDDEYLDDYYQDNDPSNQALSTEALRRCEDPDGTDHIEAPCSKRRRLNNNDLYTKSAQHENIPDLRTEDENASDVDIPDIYDKERSGLIETAKTGGTTDKQVVVEQVENREGEDVTCQVNRLETLTMIPSRGEVRDNVKPVIAFVTSELSQEEPTREAPVTSELSQEEPTRDAPKNSDSDCDIYDSGPETSLEEPPGDKPESNNDKNIDLHFKLFGEESNAGTSKSPAKDTVSVQKGSARKHIELFGEDSLSVMDASMDCKYESSRPRPTPLSKETNVETRKRLHLELFGEDSSMMGSSMDSRSMKSFPQGRAFKLLDSKSSSQASNGASSSCDSETKNIFVSDRDLSNSPKATEENNTQSNCSKVDNQSSDISENDITKQAPEHPEGSNSKQEHLSEHETESSGTLELHISGLSEQNISISSDANSSAHIDSKPDRDAQAGPPSEGTKADGLTLSGGTCSLPHIGFTESIEGKENHEKEVVVSESTSNTPCEVATIENDQSRLHRDDTVSAGHGEKTSHKSDVTEVFDQDVEKSSMESNVKEVLEQNEEKTPKESNVTEVSDGSLGTPSRGRDIKGRVSSDSSSVSLGRSPSTKPTTKRPKGRKPSAACESESDLDLDVGESEFCLDPASVIVEIEADEEGEEEEEDSICETATTSDTSFEEEVFEQQKQQRKACSDNSGNSRDVGSLPVTDGEEQTPIDVTADVEQQGVTDEEKVVGKASDKIPSGVITVAEVNGKRVYVKIETDSQGSDSEVLEQHETAAPQVVDASSPTSEQVQSSSGDSEVRGAPGIQIEQPNRVENGPEEETGTDKTPPEERSDEPGCEDVEVNSDSDISVGEDSPQIPEFPGPKLPQPTLPEPQLPEPRLPDPQLPNTASLSEGEYESDREISSNSDDPDPEVPEILCYDEDSMFDAEFTLTPKKKPGAHLPPTKSSRSRKVDVPKKVLKDKDEDNQRDVQTPLQGLRERSRNKRPRSPSPDVTGKRQKASLRHRLGGPRTPSPRQYDRLRKGGGAERQRTPRSPPPRRKDATETRRRDQTPPSSKDRRHSDRETEQSGRYSLRRKQSPSTSTERKRSEGRRRR